MAASVLVFEALVVLFAVLVAIKTGPLPAPAAWATGGGLALALLLTSGLLRFRAGYVLGWALQAALVAAGLVVPAMYFLGAVFALLWLVALRVGAGVDRVRAVREAQQE